jgi:hypothetical protein
MKFRTPHLVCLILLLSALRGADGSVLPAGEYGFEGRYGLVLSQDNAGAWTEVTLDNHAPGWGNGNFILPNRVTGNVGYAFEAGLPIAARAAYRTPWTMRPPSAQSVSVHAVTGLARRIAL